MKRIIAILLVSLMCLSFAACGTVSSTEETTVPIETTLPADATVALTLKVEFHKQLQEKPDATAQEIADAIMANPIIQFSPATMPVEPGLLSGFDNAEITGFESGVMFAPAMGTIPFVGYIFELADGTDVEAFKTTLTDNANLRWNICTEAEEMMVDNIDNTVFFIMAPKSMEQ